MSDWALLIALGLSGLACGSGGKAAVDAGGQEDSSFVGLPCEVPVGHSYVVDGFAVLPVGEGLDITGDGQPNNALGSVGPIANPVVQGQLADGTFLYLLDLGDWQGPPLRTDDDISMAIYRGLDADSPPDHSNDFGGDGAFYVSGSDLTVDCLPAQFARGALQDGMVSAVVDRWLLSVSLVSELEMSQVHSQLQFDESMSTMTLLFTGYWGICSAGTTTGGAGGFGNFLEQIVNTFGVSVADIDVDGDGLESVVGDGTSISECIDGDGTSLPGPDCACDPRIADGFSVSASGSATRANILGLLEGS